MDTKTGGQIAGQSLGPSVDRAGAPVIDPTENVKALSEAASQRQDDLREKDKEISDIKHEHAKEIAEVRERAAKELRQLNDDRLEKIRQVDQFTANINAERALTATQAIATQGSVTAETLRNTVATTASALAKQFEATVNPIVERVAALEKSSYTGMGRQAYTDPAISELVSGMKHMSELMAKGSGVQQASKDYTAWIFAAIGGIFGLVGVILGLAAFFRQ